MELPKSGVVGMITNAVDITYTSYNICMYLPHRVTRVCGIPNSGDDDVPRKKKKRKQRPVDPSSKQDPSSLQKAAHQSKRRRLSSSSSGTCTCIYECCITCRLHLTDRLDVQ